MSASARSAISGANKVAAILLLAAGMLMGLAGPDSAATKPQASLAAARMAYVPFLSSPFPYDGIIPDKQVPFLDAGTLFQRGHTSPRGDEVYWQNPTYSDRRSLIYFPAGFDIRKPAVIVVFFHGNNAIIDRDVAGRQQVPEQLAASGLNAVLLAPQFAVDALDSSAGNFWTPGFFARYMDEAATNLAAVYGDPSTRATFARMPLVFVAYSGGYDPAAYALAVGGVTKRVKGVVLLDAPYDDEDKFANFIVQNSRSAFLFSAYTASAAPNNVDLEQLLAAHRISYVMGAPPQLAPGVVAFLPTDPALNHNDFVTSAWVPDPVAWSLARIAGYPRR